MTNILSTSRDIKIFTEWLRSILQVGSVTVTFTKKDGTERVMKCTLSPELIPPASVIAEGTEPKKKKIANENVMAVYDIEAAGWRSFTLTSIKNIAISMN